MFWRLEYVEVKPGTGLRYPFRHRCPEVLQIALGHNSVVIEEGYNGRTTVLEGPENHQCNEKSALSQCLCFHHPWDLVLILLGTNDRKAIFNKTAEEIARESQSKGYLF